jgi:hypothetical protein
MNSIKNNCSQLPHCCAYCGKGYKKRTNYDNHYVLCELLHRSSKKGSIIDDKEEIPSQRKLYQMLLELGKKVNGLDEKVDEINKWVVKKKKKINIIEWLNTNITPSYNFSNITDKMTVCEEDINNLFDNSFVDVLNQIFSRTIYNNPENNLPIVTFSQKANLFYIYENADIKWVEITKENFIKFLNKIYMKISRSFSEWKKTNKDKIENDDKLQNLCDKTSIKLYSVDFRNDTTFGKIRNCMFSRMKTDIQAIVEYEFEF